MSIGKSKRGVRHPGVASRIKGAGHMAARPEPLLPDSKLGEALEVRPGAERRGCSRPIKSETRSQSRNGSVVAIDDEARSDCQCVELGTPGQFGERGHGEARELVRGLPRLVHRSVALEEVAELLG
jgi:hypothetical protein